MNIVNYISYRKKELTILSILFLLLILTLVFRKNNSNLFIYSILIIYLFVLFSQLFDLKNRVYAFPALIFLISCPFLSIFKQEAIAQSFGNHAYIFITLTILGIFFDKLREKSKLKGKIKVFKISISIMLTILITVTTIFYFNNILYSLKDTELLLKKFKSQIYFNQKHISFRYQIIDGKLKKNNMQMEVTFPNSAKEKNMFVNIFVEGWALDKNSKNNTGINIVEFWLDGKPGEGKFLGNANLGIIRDDISNAYGTQYKNCGFSGNFKIENIESGSHKIFVYALSPLFGWDYKLVDIEIKKYTNKEKIEETKLKNKNIQIFIDKPQENQTINKNFKIEGWSIDNIANLNTGIDSIEIWLDGFPGEGKLIAESNLNIDRTDVAEYLGKQQYLKSGYSFEFNKDKFKQGKHIIYIFVHSVYSGWAFRDIRIEVK